MQSRVKQATAKASHCDGNSGVFAVANAGGAGAHKKKNGTALAMPNGTAISCECKSKGAGKWNGKHTEQTQAPCRDKRAGVYGYE